MKIQLILKTLIRIRLRDIMIPVDNDTIGDIKLL